MLECHCLLVVVRWLYRFARQFPGLGCRSVVVIVSLCFFDLVFPPWAMRLCILLCVLFSYFVVWLCVFLFGRLRPSFPSAMSS